MDTFLALPDELMVKVFTFLQPSELDDIFKLPELWLTPPTHGNRHYQHLAIYGKYHGSKVMVGSGHQSGNLGLILDRLQLDYLIGNDIFITPSEINVVIQHDNWTCQTPLVEYSHYFSALTTDYNLFFRLNPDQMVDLFSCQSFNNLTIALDSIKQLTIEHRRLLNKDIYDRGGVYETSNVSPGASLEPSGGSRGTISKLPVQSLKLSLYNPQTLISHISNMSTSSSCLICSNLNHLDLSYNNIDNSILRVIGSFPPSLEHLNLSNNEITSVSFPIPPQLKSLNLANNHVVDISPVVSGSGSLYSLNLACNGLTSTMGVSQFSALRHLNLSRNRINSLFSMDGAGLADLHQLRYLNLTGNYMPEFYLEAEEGALPPRLEEIDISFCRAEGGCHALHESCNVIES
ncbi:hypothetical protein CAAN1_15S03598 [[Candida] anglica]|uniref:F-box domain-containing protein n=1 Tax=[Candida] anglica TaxID=148631 RepID=A0ABP0E8N8_9ASCO